MRPSRHNSPSGKRGRSPRGDAAQPIGVRIIGGRFRGRKLEYSGELRTRPMKDRVREALFNRLGPSLKEKTAIDLFAGTGALALEAISRGSKRAILVEQHVPTARAIRRNAATLDIENLVEVVAADTFLWHRRGPSLGGDPWLVFCSPPYDFYVDRADEMLGLVRGLIAAAPTGSVFVVESDARFDFGQLPRSADWEVRAYPPAVVGILW